MLCRVSLTTQYTNMVIVGTNRKIKTTEFDDLGFEEKPPKTHKKSKPKIPAEKEHSLDEVRNI